VQGFDAYTKYQTITDFGAVAHAGYSFAYFKGTDGMTAVNTADWPARAHAAGLAIGLYGYAQPGSAADQYRLLLKTAQARGALDLSPALDLEAPFVPGPTATSFAVAWLREAVANHQVPVFYANDSMMGYLLPAVQAAVPDTWPWIARYGSQPKNPYRTWQHSSTGTVAGITASGVDLNSGEAPSIAHAAPIIGGNDMSGMAPESYAPAGTGRQYHHRTIEVGSKSQVINEVWFSLSSGYNDIADLHVYLNGVQAPIHLDKVAANTRAWWPVPDGCESISWDYVCPGPTASNLVYTTK
jgi:GH25 family lysozyme M1 (1,4-beta-N-acetylmuramidase)